jgi:hypothetical protein
MQQGIAPQKPMQFPRLWTKESMLELMRNGLRGALTHFGVPAVRIGVILVVLDCGGISGLQVSQTGRLDFDQMAIIPNVSLGLLDGTHGSLASTSTVGRHF